MWLWHSNLYDDTWDKTVKLLTYDLSCGDMTDIFEALE